MNKNIDDILNGLSGQQPMLFNEDGLTDTIMENLPDKQLDPIEEHEKPAIKDTDTIEQTLKEPQQAPPRFIATIRVVSSVAAVWLIGLFVYTEILEESNENAVATEQKSESSNSIRLRGTLKVAYSSHFEKRSNSIYEQIKEKSKSNFNSASL